MRFSFVTFVLVLLVGVFAFVASANLENRGWNEKIDWTNDLEAAQKKAKVWNVCSGYKLFCC